ncbi:restriction endonuclease subunit S [Clostridium sp. AF15-41]|uniref:restriction endonuclease subunit S n=1 Tax=Clostridium sp. AF15-41 TaxID=2292996 RepID=UPI000E74C136|nr:restriction endonuclease subunit S [Clostridium sp. AF15-41]RJX01002.1 restriction endonuclease subunit S [Clostridium sp. AF15-41]
MIDTGALRKEIINLAVQGKLVSQKSDEGDTEDIYDLLRKKGKKTFADISEENMSFSIPNSWRWGTLSDLTFDNELNDGNWVLKEDMVDFGPVKLIQLGNIGDCKYIEKGYKYLTEEHFLELNSRQIYPGYLLINRLVVKDMYSCIIPDVKGILMTAVDVCWVAPNIEHYNIEYVMYALSSNDFRNKVQSLGHGVTRFRISKTNLINIAFPIPPISEQNRIVKKIKELFKLLDRIDALQTQYSSDLEVLKSKIIDAGIQGKLTEQLPEDGTAEELLEQIEIQKNTILKNRKGRVDKKIKAIDGDFPYEIPSHWKWIRFGNIGLFKKGPFGSALTKSMFVSKGKNTVKVYEQQHAINKDNTLGTYYITREYFDDSMSGFEVLPGDIIVSCAGTIGETYIMPDDIEQGIINQALMRVTLAEGVNRKFFQYYFDANLKKSAQNESNGSAIKNIPPFDVMKNWYFPIPPLEEQERIVEKIENILTLL